jgi:hypothetical protein
MLPFWLTLRYVATDSSADSLHFSFLANRKTHANSDLPSGGTLFHFILSWYRVDCQSHELSIVYINTYLTIHRVYIGAAFTSYFQTTWHVYCIIHSSSKTDAVIAVHSHANVERGQTVTYSCRWYGELGYSDLRESQAPQQTSVGAEINQNIHAIGHQLYWFTTANAIVRGPQVKNEQSNWSQATKNNLKIYL